MRKAENLTTKGKKSEVIAGLIDKGATLDELWEHDKGYVLNKLRVIEEALAFRRRPPPKPTFTHVYSPIVQEYAHQVQASTFPMSKVLQWLRKHLLQPDHNLRRIKHLYIVGPPLTGKTSLVQKIKDHGYRVYSHPEEDFFDNYQDGAYDLCLLDDFEGRISIQSVLCRFLDGYEGTPLRRKGRPVIYKNTLVPTIITSNYQISELPLKDQAKNALESRTKNIKLTTDRYSHLDHPIQFY